MKKEKQKATLRTAQRWSAAIALVLIALAIYIAWGGASQVKQQEASASRLEYSSQEVHAFWNAQLDQLLRVQLTGGAFPIPEINTEYQVLNQEIQQRYGKPVTVNLSEHHADASKKVLAGCQIQSGIPTMAIFVPASMDIQRDFRGSGAPDWEISFQVMMISAFLHEMIHLAKGWCGDDPDKLISNEVNTWALTNSKITPVFLAHGYPLDSGSLMMHRAWISCGGQANQCWKDFVQLQYAPVLPRRQ